MNKKPMIRWTVARAAVEFNCDRHTLTTHLKRAGIEPGADDCYTTQQIVAALHGDIDAAKLRLTNAQAGRAEVALAKERGEVLPVDIAFQAAANVMFAVRRVIETSALSNEEKDQIYAELQAFKPSSFADQLTLEQASNP
jgi:hypothetical protein